MARLCGCDVISCVFFFNDTATTEIYTYGHTLSLHDALPICLRAGVHKWGHVPELLFTFGLAFVIEELVKMVWGKLPVDYQVPKALDFSAFELFGTTYPAFRMFMLLISLAIFIALLVIMTRSRIGLIIQAALTHPHMEIGRASGREDGAGSVN